MLKKKKKKSHKYLLIPENNDAGYYFHGKKLFCKQSYLSTSALQA